MNKVLKHIVRGFALFFLVMLVWVVAINRPHRIGKTNYYLKWFDDVRCLSYLEPGTKKFLGSPYGTGVITCFDVFFDKEYILAYDALSTKYYVIRVAHNDEEFKSYRGLVFNDLLSFQDRLDSLGVDIRRMKYTKTLDAVFDETKSSTKRALRQF